MLSPRWVPWRRAHPPRARSLELGFLAGIVALPSFVKRVMPSRGDEESDEVALVAIFDGVALKSRAKAFRGGSMLAWFGGVAVDLREAQLAPDARISRALAVRRNRDPGTSRLAGRVDGEGAQRRSGDRRADAGRPLPHRRSRSTASRASAGSRSAPCRRRAPRARRCAARSGSSSRSPSASFVLSPRHRGNRSRDCASSCSRGSFAGPGCTRRQRRTSCGSRSSSSEASSGRPRRPSGEFEQSPKKLAVRKAGGNVIELGSIFAFGFSPLWLLAAAADVTHGTRVYLDALVAELKRAGVIAPERRARIRRRSARRARGSERYDRAPDRHPAARGRGTQAVARGSPRGRKGAPDAAGAGRGVPGLVAEAEREKRSLLEVSVGMGLAFFNSARKVGRQHVLDPYTRGSAAAPRRGVRGIREPGRPALRAGGRAPLRPAPPTLTERGIGRVGGSKLLESECDGRIRTASARARGSPSATGRSRSSGSTRSRSASTCCGSRTRCGSCWRTSCGTRTGSRDGGRRRGRRRLGCDRRAVTGDLVHAGPRAAPGLHRRPGGRRPRRDAKRHARPRRRPGKINPLLPVELVIDHSVQVDEFASRLAIFRNAELEFERNRERYAFLRWGQGAFDNFKVVPPSTGIVHQVNLEFLARVVDERDGVAFPDTLVGTDSHTTMINGLGVLGWGVGGIEAEAAMLGEAVSMLVPQVVGFRLTGRAPGGRDRDRPRPHGHADPARGGRRREVRRVLRPRARPGCRSPTARRSGTCRPSTARRAASSRSTPRRFATCA